MRNPSTAAIKKIKRGRICECPGPGEGTAKAGGQCETAVRHKELQLGLKWVIIQGSHEFRLDAKWN